MTVRTIVATFGLLLSCAAPSFAQSVKLEFSNGRVNLTSENAPLRTILAEWTRLGGTRIVNGDRVPGAPLTLQLTGVPERQALDILLRGAAGYMVTARAESTRGASAFDRVMILPTSTAPRPTASATFGPVQPPQTFDDNANAADDPTETPVNALGRPRVVNNAPGQAGQPAPAPGVVVVRPANQPAPPANPPLTFTIGNDGTPVQVIRQEPAAPAAAPAPARPGTFTVLPGSSRPGEITPPPTTNNR
jgi:hypothetical protein